MGKKCNFHRNNYFFLRTGHLQHMTHMRRVHWRATSRPTVVVRSTIRRYQTYFGINHPPLSDVVDMMSFFCRKCLQISFFSALGGVSGGELSTEVRDGGDQAGLGLHQAAARLCHTSETKTTGIWWWWYTSKVMPSQSLWFHILQVLAKNSVSDIEKREKKVLEKKLGEMEDELKVSDSLKNGMAKRKFVAPFNLFWLQWCFFFRKNMLVLKSWH